MTHQIHLIIPHLHLAILLDQVGARRPVDAALAAVLERVRNGAVQHDLVRSLGAGGEDLERRVLPRRDLLPHGVAEADDLCKI